MEPKEKAKELMREYVNLHPYSDTIEVRKCALIAVNLVLNSLKKNKDSKYWQEVYEEIIYL